MREIEFEYDDSGSGQFRPSGNVIRTIMTHLKKDEMDEAVSLLVSAGEEACDMLIKEAEAGASKPLWRRLIRLFEEARDPGRAATAAIKAGEEEKAAVLLEAAYDWTGAGKAYEKTGDKKKAAQMFERGLAYNRAATLYEEAGEYENSASCLARAGEFFLAGRKFMKIGSYKHAVEALQQIHRRQKYYIQACALLGRFFDRTQQTDMAIERYSEVVRMRPIDDVTENIHHRLATLLSFRGKNDAARAVWEGVLRFKPDHEGALSGLKQLDSPAPSGIESDIPRPALSRPPSFSSFPSLSAGEAQDPPPLILPGDGEAGAVESPKNASVFAVRPDFDFLRKMPVFSSLTFNEMNTIYDIGRKMIFNAGEVLIEQDQPGRNVFVILEGQVQVDVSAHGKDPVLVATLGKGATVGEMALIDSAPTSARVTAVDDVTVFCFDMDRLESQMDADPRIGSKMLKVMGRILSTRLREANRIIAGG